MVKRILLITCAVVLCAPQTTIAAPPVAVNPAPSAAIYDDELILFEWAADYSDSGYSLKIYSPDGTGPTTIVGSELMSYLFYPTSIDPGEWLWTACIAQECSQSRALTVMESPTINRAIATSKVRKIIKRKWRVGGAKVRCVLDGEAMYSCTVRWMTRHTRFRGSGSVALIDHEYFTPFYVTSRERR